MVTGIGVNTGEVAAGGMGTADRLHYAVIGDTVNVTQRIEDLTRELGETSAIVSQDTYEALGVYREDFMFAPMGDHLFKGKSEPIMVYRLLPVRIEAPQPILVNINVAPPEDLMILKGISSRIANNIVEYRNTHGNFSHIDEIKKVSGIGKIRFRRIKDYITTADLVRT